MVQSHTETAETPSSQDADSDAATACITALVEHGIPVDTIELLVRGSLRLGIKPGALTAAIKATVKSYKQSA